MAAAAFESSLLYLKGVFAVVNGSISLSYSEWIMLKKDVHELSRCISKVEKEIPFGMDKQRLS